MKGIAGDSDGEPQRPEFVGLYSNEEKIIEAFNIWTLSGYQVLPRAGGWLDQDPYEAADLLLLLRMMRYVKHRTKQSKGFSNIFKWARQQKQTYNPFKG